MRANFATTRWTLVLSAGNADSVGHRQALAQLLDDYWYPLYTYLRRMGKSAQESEDAIQGFYAKLLEKNILSGLSGEDRGRFRNFLLVCLKNFVATEWKKETAEKRGGGNKPISIDARSADQRYTNEPSHDLTPERAFERAWAIEMVQRSLSRVSQAWTDAGKSEKFEVLKVFLLPDDQVPSYAECAEQLNLKIDALKVTIFRLRAEFRRALCAEVAETLDRHDLLEDEINRLFSAICL